MVSFEVMHVDIVGVRSGGWSLCVRCCTSATSGYLSDSAVMARLV